MGRRLTPSIIFLANAFYEENKKTENGFLLKIRSVERQFKLKAGQLRYYRANKNRRKDSGVETVFINQTQETK